MAYMWQTFGDKINPQIPQKQKNVWWIFFWALRYFPIYRFPHVAYKEQIIFSIFEHIYTDTFSV
jgi:hypothetical protein